MKKNYTYLLLLLLITSVSLNAQSLAFSFAQPTVCYTAGGTNQTVSVTSSPPGATTYSWYINSVTSCGPTYTNSAVGSSTVISLGTCCGVYSVTCYAYNSSMVLLSSITQTTGVMCPNWLGINAAPNSGGLCAGQQGTLTLSGGVSYTWMPSGNSNSLVATPTISTCYTVGATNSSGCVIMTTACFSVFPLLAVTATTSASSICAGATTTLSCFGATTYTWMPGGFTGGSIVVSPASSTVYTVTGTNGMCSGTATVGISVTPNPTPVISGNTVICIGSTTTLSASGASSYTWLPGGSNSSSIVVSPTTSTIYTVTGSNGMCTGSTMVPVLVMPIPTLVAAPSATSSCPGSTVMLFAGGANTYSWSTGATTPTIIVSPMVSTCYSVMGTNVTTGCWALSVICVTVLPSPTLIVSPNTTVCLGSSATLTVSGASSYTWAPLASSGASAVVMPTTTTTYTVAGQGGSNNCTSYNFVTVTVDPNCSDVWPGDANSDGVVNSSDVFEIGLAFSNTGPARSPGGNTYISQYALNWSGTVSSGKNKCHADCDGDGTINNADTIAIYNNYLLTHSFRPSGNSAVNGDVNLVVSQNVVNEGAWNKADILLGSSSSPISQLYGVAFDIDFDNAVIESNSAYVKYTSSFLNASNQNVQFRKTDFANGVVYAASVRVDGSNVSGDGKIGEFWFKVKSGLPANTTLNMSVSNSSKIGNTGIGAALTGGNTTAAVISNPVGMKEPGGLEQAIRFFPNPAASQLTLLSDVKTSVNYTVYDVIGRKVLEGEFTGTKTLDISTFKNGAYIMCFESGLGVSYKKLVIDK